MEKSELAAKYVKIIKRCFIAVKVLVPCTVMAVIALAVFSAAGSASGMRENNFNMFILGVVITAGVALVLAIAPIICLLIAKINLKKLEKLDLKEAGE